MSEGPAKTLLERLASRLGGETGTPASRTAEERRRADREISSLRTELDRTREALALAGAPDRRLPVFFIVGFAKSGTSWVTRMMNAHPEVLCKGEGIFFGRGADLGARHGLLTPTSLHGAIADSEDLRTWVERSVWTRGEDVDRHLTNLTRISIRYFLGEKLAASGKKLVGDKTPFVTEDCLEEIGLLFPEARVIHVIRDGRDIAVSAIHHIWNHATDAGGHMKHVKPEELSKRDRYREDPAAFLASGESIFDEGRLRRGFAEVWSRMCARTVEDGPRLLGENYAEVRYEDLLERPLEETGRLLRFLGADDSRQTVECCVEAASFERLTKGRERGVEDSSSFFRKGVSSDWKHVFSERDRQVFKEVAGDLLITLGYEKDDDW